MTPLFLGEVVRTYSWIIVLGNNGFINSVLLELGLIERPIQFMFTTFGVVVALVHVTMPVMVIMLAAALSHIDRDYEKAAESLGAGPIRAFLTVTLPLSMPGIIAGVTTAFAWTFSAFATPQLIGGGRVNMVSNLVYQLGFASFNFPFAASLCVAGLALTIVVLSAAAARGAAARKHRAALRCRARPTSACLASVGTLVVLLILGFLVLPAVVVTIAAFNDKAILSFPPQAWSLRWFAKAHRLSGFSRRLPQRPDRHAVEFDHRAGGRRRCSPSRSTVTGSASRPRSKACCCRRW